MKIAIYQPRASYYTGGGEVIPINHALHLARLGHEITFITTRASFIQESEIFQKLKNVQGLSIIYIDLPSEMKWIYDQPAGHDWRRWDLESLHVGLLARDIISKIDVDLAVAHLIFDIIALPENTTKVMHLHGYPAEFSYHHELLASLPCSYISVSNQIQTNWSKILPKNVQKYVLENGVDTNIFKPMLKSNLYDVLYIGRLLPVKGIDTLIDALKLSSIKFKVAIAGIGPMEAELKARVNEKGLEEYIEFLGYVPDADLPNLYASSKVIALPSKDREGILTTLLEAAACRKPIVTTTAGSMSEFINDGINGRLVPPDTPEELSSVIQNMLSDQQMLDELSDNSLSTVRNGWDWDTRIKLLEQIYIDINSSQGLSNE